MSKIFRASCDLHRRRFVLEYFGDGSVPVKPTDPLGLIENPSGKRPAYIRFRVVMDRPGQLIGRTPADARLLATLQSEAMAIDAKSEMGEPWYIGRSEALLRVAKFCAKGRARRGGLSRNRL
jgi:hypothetical protein